MNNVSNEVDRDRGYEVDTEIDIAEEVEDDSNRHKSDTIADNNTVSENELQTTDRKTNCDENESKTTSGNENESVTDQNEVKIDTEVEVVKGANREDKDIIDIGYEDEREYAKVNKDLVKK